MKPVDGLDLAFLTAETKQENIEQRKKEVRHKISMVLGRFTEAQGSIANLEKQLTKAKERLEKERAKLELLEKGDWSAIQDDEKKDGQQKGEKEEPEH